MTIIERLDRTTASDERERLAARLRGAAGTDNRDELRARSLAGSLTDAEADDAARLETLDYLLDDRV